jgi:hypothetical protein
MVRKENLLQKRHNFRSKNLQKWAERQGLLP